MGEWRKQVGRIKSLWAITALFLLALGCAAEPRQETPTMQEETMKPSKETSEPQKAETEEDLAEVVSGAEAATKGENEEPRHEDLAMDYVILSKSKEHLRTNTPLGQQMFHRPGYQP
ncbi:MAG: hypothetical protein IKQ24_03780, partial [Verrucomicrobia bacterium]|nr:hypothetical protein [Verrucomicrobiota bacterium]